MRNEPQHESFTVKEAAGNLGISPTLARDLIRDGQLVAYRYGPRKTIIYREDLEAFRKSRRVETPGKREAS
jgi:excisionase family DNA binding protein